MRLCYTRIQVFEMSGRCLKPSRSTSGSTLTELLIVVCVIGLLAALAIPQFSNQRAKGVDSQMKSDLKNAATAMESYFAHRQEYPTSLSGISVFGFKQTTGVTLTINVTSPSSFTLGASKPGGSQASFTYDSTTGVIN
jgi:type IV pilus assembly protein PilA